MKDDHRNESRTGQILHELFKEVFALHATLSQLMDQVHEQAGLSTPQRRIIQSLNRLGSATVPDMAARLGVSRQSVQVVCNDLLSKGYIEFKSNPRHRRSKLAFLTDTGDHAHQQAQQNEFRLIEQVLQGIDSKQAEQARDLLSAIRKALDTDG